MTVRTLPAASLTSIESVTRTFTFDEHRNDRNFEIVVPDGAVILGGHASSRTLWAGMAGEPHAEPSFPSPSGNAWQCRFAPYSRPMEEDGWSVEVTLFVSYATRA
ncbi:hypothetical protein ABZ419_13830 [Streptomyces cinnamoneus]|uniref:hypothetical protein n=1 Tax=Streptomyces cinnamoneus TaxID=53446 RepID=UPI00340CB8D6